MKSRIILTLFFAMVTTGYVYAAEGVDEATATAPPEALGAGASTIGIGTEGYGSPVESERISMGEIVSARSRRFHPFISVGGFYTDNLFNTESNERSDWVTVMTPGVWLAVPGAREKMVDINTMNMAPGGLAISRFRPEVERRFQGYALYRADIREHDKYSSENRTDQRAEGMLQFNLRGGLSLQLLDVLEFKADPYGTPGTPSRLQDKYSSNLFNAILSYRISPKLVLRADYGNYYLDYDAARNDYRNRDDNSVAAYLYYNLTPKTSMFLQTEYIAVDYDTDTKSDNDEINTYFGINLKTSAKTRARLKVGYGKKEYDRGDYDDSSEWLAEAQMDYFFTPKTSIYLRGSRRVLESDIADANNILSYRAQIGYRQRMTAKLRGEAAAYLRNDDYDGIITQGTQTAEREDDSYGFTIALGLTPRRWFNISIGYDYRHRDSNFNSEDYASNTIFLRMTAAL